ncbi:hypothetical protein LR48_Vigan454s000900 [Vigna angularis]|uniref:Uncharacterized protein n=1 Tax=Phaseolus angularis TaxID=3914 RepID=A0A0L9TAS3_PHAAN|nr:hypothetical protein LR48_Vigan454s000900 [Vigna angularis]
MDHSSAYGNRLFPYNAQPQSFDLLCEPFIEHPLRQPPPYFQSICEQPPWLMQQQLPHLYWDQCAEPEQENFQAEQSWQPQFCDQQQGILASKLQGLTTQVAYVSRDSLSNHLYAKEEFIICKLDGNDPERVTGESRHQVFFKLNLPIDIDEVQPDFNVFDMFKVELIEHALNSVPIMPIHSHICDSALEIKHIDIPVTVHDPFTNINFYDRFNKAIAEELEQVYSELELPICLGEMQIKINDHVHVESQKLLPDILTVMPSNSELVDENFVVNHRNTPTDGCSDFNALNFDDLLGYSDFTFDSSVLFDDSLMCADYDVADDIPMADIDCNKYADTNSKDAVLTVQGRRVANGGKLTRPTPIPSNHQLQTLNGELRMLQQMTEKKDFNAAMEAMRTWAEHGENPISSFFSLLLNRTKTWCLSRLSEADRQGIVRRRSWCLQSRGSSMCSLPHRQSRPSSLDAIFLAHGLVVLQTLPNSVSKVPNLGRPYLAQASGGPLHDAYLGSLFKWRIFIS